MAHFCFSYKGLALFLLNLILLPVSVWAADKVFVEKISSVPIVREGGRWVSDWVQTKIPPGLVSMQIIAIGSSNSLIQITDLIDPQGRTYVESDFGDPPKLNSYSKPVLRNVVSANRSEGVVPGTGTLIIPNNPHLEPPSEGLWTFRSLSRKEPKEKSVSFWLVGKFQEDLKKKTVRIRVWLAPGSYWTENKYRANDLLQKTKEHFLETNLNLDVISVETLSSAPQRPMKLPEDMANIALETNDPQVINVYLMGEMEFQTKPMNGFACLGGPAGIQVKHGCFASVYASENADEVSLQSQAKVLVHELGHYLGLFHTKDTGYVEINNVFDKLSDTEEVITGKNMMDPGIYNKIPKFSRLQIKMLQLSPALQ